MAILKNNALGSISGMVGNLIFRNFNGKTTVSTKPETVNVSKSPKALAAQSKMGLMVRLSHAMNFNFLIKTLWQLADIPASNNQNKQIKINYSQVENVDDISSIVLFPVERFFSASFISAVFEEDNLKIIFLPSQDISSIAEKVYPEISLHGVTKLYDNSEIDPKKTTFLPLSSSGISLIKGVPLEINILIQGQDLIAINEYPLHSFTAGLVINDRNGNTVYFSENINGEF